MSKQFTRPWRRLSLRYRLHCAREDVKLRNLITPVGVWVCEHCPHVSLTTDAHFAHLTGVHA